MATFKVSKGVSYDPDHDYQADINAAVAKGDYKTAGEKEIQRNAKGTTEGIAGFTPTYNYVGYANNTYNGTSYNNATDYGLLAASLAAAGDLEGAKNAEKAGNAKILGENMSYALRNNYGALDYESDAKSGTDAGTNTKYETDPEMANMLNDILGAYQNAVSSSGGISMPSYSAPSYNPQYDEQIDELLNKLLNRDPFEYNEELDPLYQQYKDMYTKQGQLAMEDTMGQAAALTGGYSSTYSQAVGQQMYNAYLNKVQELLPEFYDRAYGQYQDEGTNIKDLYGMYIQRDQVDFQRYQQEVANAQAAYQAAAAAASMAYQQQQDSISNLGNLYGVMSSVEANNYQKYLDQVNMDTAAEESAYQRYLDQLNIDMTLNKTNYDRNQAADQTQYERSQAAQELARDQVSAILAAGGTPSSALVSQSGLSGEYVQAMKNYYAQQLAAQGSSSGNGNGGGDKTNNYYSKGSNVVNKTTKQTTSQPDSDSAQLLAALYNGEITPTQYKEYLDAMNAQNGRLKAK